MLSARTPISGPRRVTSFASASSRKSARCIAAWSGFYLRYRPLPFGFLQFACRAFVETWARELPGVAYAGVYARDGLRCTNPVCASRCVTPHHVRFRSHGGSDASDNVTSLCPFCHLEGVHAGRISVSGEAPSQLTWRIGRHTTVTGRSRFRTA